VWDPSIHMCANCLVWRRRGIQNGKAIGICAFNPPVVQHFRQVVFNQRTTAYDVHEASSSGWPSSFADDTCRQHVPDPRKGAL
jgi:hypothetical protein